MGQCYGECREIGRHQFLITLLLICKKWMRTSIWWSFRGCARLSLTWGLGCPVGVDGPAPPRGVSPAGFWVHALSKYLDPAGDRDWFGPRTRHMGVLNFLGTVLVAWQCKGSRVTWQLAVQYKVLLQGILNKNIITIRGLWIGVD